MPRSVMSWSYISCPPWHLHCVLGQLYFFCCFLARGISHIFQCKFIIPNRKLISLCIKYLSQNGGMYIHCKYKHMHTESAKQRSHLTLLPSACVSKMLPSSAKKKSTCVYNARQNYRDARLLFLGR